MIGLVIRRTLFPLGSLYVTPGAEALAAKHNVDLARLLSRHAQADHGSLDDEDVMRNERAISDPMMMIQSNYPLTPDATRYSGDRIWIITDAGRAVTTILLPSDY